MHLSLLLFISYKPSYVRYDRSSVLKLSRVVEIETLKNDPNSLLVALYRLVYRFPPFSKRIPSLCAVEALDNLLAPVLLDQDVSINSGPCLIHIDMTIWEHI
jgi:hypothetical protein